MDNLTTDRNNVSDKHLLEQSIEKLMISSRSELRKNHEELYCATWKGSRSYLFDSCESLSSRLLPSVNGLSHGSLFTSHGSLPANCDLAAPSPTSMSPRVSAPCGSFLSLSCLEDSGAGSSSNQAELPMFHVTAHTLWSRPPTNASSGTVESASPLTETNSDKCSLEDTTIKSDTFAHIRRNKRLFVSTEDPFNSNQADAPSPPKRACAPKRRSLSKWTKAEDEKLEEGVLLYGIPNWKPIANHVGTRNNKMCAQRWHTCLRPETKGAKKGKWTKEEDERLRQILSNFGHKNAQTWEKAVEGMGFTRNNKQCRERWTNFLDPSLRFGPWTDEEDAHLLRLYEESGNKWKLFTKELVGRSAERIRRRFKMLNKRLNFK